MTDGATAPGLGLVVKVTTHTQVKHARRSLNRERRVRHMRRVVVRSADASRLSSESGGFRAHCVMVTLTYRADAKWAPNHVRSFINAARMHVTRRGAAFRYQWVIELTKLGRPHYHVLFWLPHGMRLPKPDQAGWWPHGLSRIERARRAVGYLVKYASKGAFDDAEHELPSGARLFGCGNSVDERHDVRRARLPVWLERATEHDQLPRRVAFVGFVCRQTGEVFRTPYLMRFARDPDGFIVVLFETREAQCSESK